jgi:hypothetical protein
MVNAMEKMKPIPMDDENEWWVYWTTKNRYWYMPYESGKNKDR